MIKLPQAGYSCVYPTDCQHDQGAALHLEGDSAWVVPLAVQGIQAVLLFGCMIFCNESPRWLAKQDRWEQAHTIISRVRKLPKDHPYIQAEYGEIATQLENERQLIGGAGFKDLMREMWTIPGNRKGAIISITLMICQQMTGTNLSFLRFRVGLLCASRDVSRFQEFGGLCNLSF